MSENVRDNVSSDESIEIGENILHQTLKLTFWQVQVWEPMNGGSTTLTDCSNGPLYFWYMFLHCHNVKNFREHIMSYLIKLAIPMKGGNAKISGCIYLFKSIDHTNYFLLEQDNGKETHQWLTF